MDIEQAVNLVIANVIKEGLNDVFDRPYEIDLLSNKLFCKKVQEEVIKLLKGNSLETLKLTNIAHVLMPKNTAFDFRRCALIQPMDLLKYNALVVSIADEIEKNRVPVSQKRVFSYRFRPNKGYLFSKHYTITAFRRRVHEKVAKKKAKFIVSCDISNFYDRLNLHRLECSLMSCGCDKEKVGLINRLLLFWSNRDSYGLPVGSNGSRILAEASLVGVDRYLLDMEVDFIRFVDDYRLFAPDTTTAHYWLTILIERLWSEGLTINKSKTKIEGSEEYKKVQEVHEKIRKSDIDKNPFKIIAGYGGTVPTRFRELSEKEIASHKTKNPEELIEKLAKVDFIEAEQIIEIIKTIVSSEKYEQIAKAVGLLDRYPQLTPYVVDALIKIADKLSEEVVRSIREEFKKKLENERYIPEYLAIAYIRMLGSKRYYDKAVLLHYYRGLKRNSGAYIGRALLESLETELTREDAIEIRKGFDRADYWEKRQILRLVNKNLIEDEKAPWFKNLRIIETHDLFLTETIKPTTKR